MKFYKQILKVASLLGLLSFSAYGVAQSNAIEAINVATQGDSVTLKVSLKNPLAAIPASFSIASPARVALDFPDTANSLGKNAEQLSTGGVRGYNVIQSIVAVGSGGILGKGLGHGTQSHLRFLPERHTDFIFASLAEELGVFGSILVLLCLGALLYRLLSLATHTRSSGSRLIYIGVFGYLAFQTFVNIGMNIGIAPVTGVTLPLISYGGSSVLSTAIMLGIVLLGQQVEGHVLQPLVMGTAVKMHPLAVVFAVAAGGFLAGIPGALFAVPVVAALNVMVRYVARGEWRVHPKPTIQDVLRDE